MSKILTSQIIKNVIANVIKYTIILTFQFPCEKYCPTIVEEIIEGNLQNVAIAINLVGFIGNNAPKYVNKSFGVPTIAKHIANINSRFLGF